MAATKSNRTFSIAISISEGDGGVNYSGNYPTAQALRAFAGAVDGMTDRNGVPEEMLRKTLESHAPGRR